MTTHRQARATFSPASLLTCLGLVACGADASASPRVEPRGAAVATLAPQEVAAGSSGTNRARFTFAVDLQGMPGTLTMDVEAIGSSGVLWGPGSTPSITSVIGTGEHTLYTSGRLTSGSTSYAFTGENQFADFTELTSYERFRVQWVIVPRGLRMIVNPFGQGPVSYDCVLQQSEPL